MNAVASEVDVQPPADDAEGRRLKSRLYAKAEAALRKAHRQEFDDLLAKFYAEEGLVYEPRPSAAEREAEAKRKASEDAAERIRAILDKHPDAARLVGLELDPDAAEGGSFA